MIFKRNKIKFKNIQPEQRKKYQSYSLDKKISLAEKVIKKGLKRFKANNSAVAWTGGKDSTLLLWLVNKVCEEDRLQLPKVMFVDEGDVFDEILEFVHKIKQEWKLDFNTAHNKDVSSKAKKIGDLVKVKDLNDRNKKELKRLGFEKKEFPYLPESFVGNHLMKTVATNIWIEKNAIKALFTGVRWDEQEARSEDDFIRKMDNPTHFRVEPILHFFEKDVWEATHKNKIPYISLYKDGYRSLGAKSTTKKTGDKPAWEQNMEEIKERAGRQQDKEKIMQRLRELGYM